jgi:hypothetical protein
MDKIVERLRDIKSDVVGLEVDHDDVEFNVNGKTIEVYDVTINGVDDISRDIESLIDDIEEGKID